MYKKFPYICFINRGILDLNLGVVYHLYRRSDINMIENLVFYGITQNEEAIQKIFFIRNVFSMLFISNIFNNYKLLLLFEFRKVEFIS